MQETAGIVTPTLELEGVTIYQDSSPVLTNVNLTVQKGEMIYLIGRTGSGKSSLLKTLYGDLPLKQGKGTVVGFDLSQLTWKKLPALRRKIGIIFQDFNLLNDRSIHDNLAFVLKATGWKEKDKIKTRIEEVLTQVGLHTKGFKKPHELSGGEQQRVVIARALLNTPELILADEPTGNLDPETSQDILRLLRQLNEKTGTPILMATHDYSMIEKFPGRIVTCQQGKITEADSFEV